MVGTVTVKTANDVRTVDKAYHYVQVTGDTARVSEAQAVSEARLSEKYGELLKAQPSKAVAFVLYFLSGTTQLTKESLAVIAKVVGTIQDQASATVTVIGHTDTRGTEETNEPLSLNRAKAVEKMLKAGHPALRDVNVHFFGSREPLVPTGPNVDEPKNRRVEVLIL
jgi:OOP family OmpA-OmpF porin